MCEFTTIPEGVKHCTDLATAHALTTARVLSEKGLKNLIAAHGTAQHLAEYDLAQLDERLTGDEDFVLYMLNNLHDPMDYGVKLLRAAATSTVFAGLRAVVDENVTYNRVMPLPSGMGI